VRPSGFPDKRWNQAIRYIDEGTVEIRNAFGSKIIPTARLAKMTWTDRSFEGEGTWEFRPLEEVLQLIDEEIAGGN
jgi:hypothetical protein